MLVTEIDAASNTSVDNVRQVIVTSSTFSPGVNQYRIFIIDEVHQLSGAAFNALLKTIEEPPPRVVFIMATTELQKVPDTILSRCQVFEFRTIPLSKIVAELKRIAAELGIKISDSALGTIARAGEGSMRDAESAFDQVISFAGAEVSDEDVSAALGLPGFETLRATVEAVADQDSQAILRIVDTIVTRGYDIRNFCREVMTYIRNLLVVKVAGFDQELTQMPQSEAEWTTRLADRFSDQDLIRFFSILSKTEQDIRLSSQPRFQLEIGLVKMAQAARLYPIEEAIDRMAAIEASLKIQSPSDQALPPRPTPNAMGSATHDRAGGASKRTDRSATTTTGHAKGYTKRTSEPPSESSGSTGLPRLATRNPRLAQRCYGRNSTQLAGRAATPRTSKKRCPIRFQDNGRSPRSLPRHRR
jgi:DNA polymerase-3 subunit gamma/tau